MDAVTPGLTLGTLYSSGVGINPISYIYKMLSAEDVPGMVQIFHICERDKKRTLPSTPFLRAWLVAELGAKNRAIRDPAVRPQIPRGKELRAGSRIVIFLIFANFGPRKIGYQRCFRPEKRQNGKKMEIYASHTI